MADTPRTNAEIDKFNEVRKANGMELLPYEIEGQSGNVSDEEKVKNEKIAADAETERLSVEAENKAKEGGENNQPPANTPIKADLTKEEKEAIARELFGVTDLSELVKKSEFKKDPTPDEIEAAKQQRENDKIAFALKNGKFTTKQYERFIADSKDPIALVQAQYSKEQKEIDPTLTDAEIESEFNSKYGLEGAEDSRQYKRGLKEINLLAENILKNTYSKIYEVDNDFNTYETEQLTQKQLADKLISDAPNYKRTVEEVYAGLKKIEIDLGKGGKYEVEISDEVINGMKQRELNNDYAATQIKKGYTKEEKAEAAKLTMIYENLPTIIQSVADKINEKRQAGSKGIPPLGGENAAPAAKKLTPEQQEQVDRIYGKQMPVAN